MREELPPLRADRDGRRPDGPHLTGTSRSEVERE